MSAEPAAKKSRFDGQPEIKYTKILINNEWHDSGASLQIIIPALLVCVGACMTSCQLEALRSFTPYDHESITCSKGGFVDTFELMHVMFAAIFCSTINGV